MTQVEVLDAFEFLVEHHFLQERDVFHLLVRKVDCFRLFEVIGGCLSRLVNGQHLRDLLVFVQLSVHLCLGTAIDLSSTHFDVFEELVHLNSCLEQVHFLVGESCVVSEVDSLDLREVFDKLCQEVERGQVFALEV